ncbi:MAG: sensor histidine kinase [Clostridia bacterium]|nr:sensor histidine kinase [Clostridia bacterium]
MFRKDSIAYKYLKVFILILVLPIFIISIVVNNIYISILLKNSSDQVKQSMEQISTGIENEVTNLVLTQATITDANDYEILELATQWNRAEEQSQKFEISRQIVLKLSYLFNYRSDVEEVAFFFRNGGNYFYKTYPTVEEEKIRKMDWYKKTMEANGKPVVHGSISSFFYNLNSKYVMSLSVSPNAPVNINDVEAVYVAFKTNIFDSIYSEYQINRLGEMIILDDQGKVMVTKNKELLGKGIEEFGYLKKAFTSNNSSYTETVSGKKMFITTYTVKKTGWKIVNLLSYGQLTREINKTLTYVIIISSFIIILFIAFSVLFFRGILNPMNSLVKNMKRVEKGDLNASADIGGDGEIQALGRAFNKMVLEIRNLIKERDLKERQRSKAEIEALQSQINPHFISNTLNSIRLMAMIAKVDSIKNITEAFMKLLTESFGKGGTMTTVEREIENLKNYVYIMKVRYGDKFDVEFNVSEDIKSCCILKLVLQPILENAITHGVSEIEEKGIISIKGCSDEGDIQFEILDNGHGMSEEQVERLLSEDFKNPRGFSSIGIWNVDRRIKLNHGEKYGLRIDSALGEFTKVRILLPMIKENQEEKVNV